MKLAVKHSLSPEQEAALDWLKSHRADLVRLNDEIWGYAEPALREYESAAAHVRELTNHGFTVEEGAAGMPTAFVATYGDPSSGPVIGLFSEYDATPGNSQRPLARREPVIPHAAGFEDAHNAIGAAGTMAAIAISQAMKSQDVRGAIKLFGTPAEKLCIGKPYLASRGYFDDLDAVVAWHPRRYNTVTRDNGPDCYQILLVEFNGVAVYGGRPWAGASALDALTLCNVIVNFQKEHIPRYGAPSLNEIVTVGGQCPTNLPEYTQVWYAMRATDRETIEIITDMIQRAADASAMATGCKARLRIVSATRPWLPNHVMTDVVYRNFEFLGGPKFDEQTKQFARDLQKALDIDPWDAPLDEDLTSPEVELTADFRGGADDVTEFCWHAPTARLHVAYFIQGPRGYDFPSWINAAQARTGTAHECAYTAARVMAASTVELLGDQETLAAAQQELAERLAEKNMHPLIPDDAILPVDAGYSFPPYYPPDWSPPVGRSHAKFVKDAGL